MNFEKTDLVKIGKYISDLRKNKNLTQVQLAELLNVSNKTISKWELGDLAPDITLLNSISEVFGISVDELLSGKSNNNKNSWRFIYNITKYIFIIFVIATSFIVFAGAINNDSSWKLNEIYSEGNNYSHGYVIRNNDRVKVIIDSLSLNENFNYKNIKDIKYSLYSNDVLLIKKNIVSNNILKSMNDFVLFYEDIADDSFDENNIILNLEYDDVETKENINIYYQKKN